MDENSTVLELAGVTKEYRGSPPVRALDGVNLSVHAGEFVAIVGPSGSGKSTLINVVGALHRPTTGTVRIDGRDVSRLSDARLAAVRGRRIGFVFQQFNLVEGLTALENVATGLLYAGVGRSARNGRARRPSSASGSATRPGDKPGALSGGERQRVGIARALVGEPAIILADEPTGNLDSKTGAAIVALFRELHAVGHTVVLITHDRDIAEQAPRQVSLLDGAIVDDLAARVMSLRRAGLRSKLRVGDLGRVGVVGLRARRLRTMLTALGIAIGIAAMVAVVGISASSKADLIAEIDALGTDLSARPARAVGVRRGDHVARARPRRRRSDRTGDVDGGCHDRRRNGASQRTDRRCGDRRDPRRRRGPLDARRDQRRTCRRAVPRRGDREPPRGRARSRRRPPVRDQRRRTFAAIPASGSAASGSP